MNFVTNILNRPYPNEFRSGRTIAMAWIGAVCVTLTLLIFQPFGLSGHPFLFLIKYCSIFGFISFSVVMLIGYAQNNWLKKFTEEEQWSVKKEILMFFICLLVIGTFNVITCKLITNSGSVSIYIFIKGLVQTVIVGIVPITAITLTKQIRLVNKYANEAKRLEAELSKVAVAEEETITNNSIAVIPVAETNNQLTSALVFDEFQADNIILICAADNYIKIFNKPKDGTVQSSLKRLTMKNAEDILCTDDSRFFRCHRAFIIRIDTVEHITGNAQGYKLHIPGIDFVIPVSRSLNNIIADKIKHRKSTLKVA